MIELRIVLGDFSLLRVFKSANKVVYTTSKFFPPFLAVEEPENASMDIQISHEYVRAYICFACSTLNFLARRNLNCRNTWVSDFAVGQNLPE